MFELLIKINKQITIQLKVKVIIVFPVGKKNKKTLQTVIIFPDYKCLQCCGALRGSTVSAHFNTFLQTFHSLSPRKEIFIN